jgi:hypothetical protein
MAAQLPRDLRDFIYLQQGVVTSGQLIAAGITKDMIKSKVRSGRWQRTYRGVYATFSGELGRPAALWAGVLSAGTGAMLSHRTAAEAGRLTDSRSGLIHITVPGSRRVTKMPGIVVHYSARVSQALHPALLPPQTRIEETILDLAGTASTIDNATAWVLAGFCRRLTTQARLNASMDRRARLRWRRELAELLTEDAAGLHSILERRYDRDVERPHGLPSGSRQAHAKRGDRSEYRDRLYDAYQVAIELDGELTHPDETRWKDIRRDNAAAADGIITLRYGWLDVTRMPCKIAAEVASVLPSAWYRSSALSPVGRRRVEPARRGTAGADHAVGADTQDGVSCEWSIARRWRNLRRPGEPRHQAPNLGLPETRAIDDARPMTRDFIPGLELARTFYVEAIRPLLDQQFPGLRHTAALIGPGSEVQGFDSARSTDHDWGPRLQVFLSDEDARDAAGVTRMLTARLAPEFRGYPMVFAASGADPESASHWVTVTGLRHGLTGMLGFDPTADVQLLDWLATPTEVLAELTGGAVFHDGLAEGTGNGLAAVRARLAWYPRDVWLYVLACQWQRIAQEEAFPGRCAEAGDDLGSAVITSRLVRDLMRLVLLMERQYPPYSKWLGSAFARTDAGSAIAPALASALSATTWPERELNLCAGIEAVARLHNQLGVTAPVDPAVRPTYYERPFRVLDSGRFVRALSDAIADERVRELAPIGAVDQFVDSTDAIGDPTLLRSAVAAALGLAAAGSRS